MALQIFCFGTATVEHKIDMMPERSRFRYRWWWRTWLSSSLPLRWRSPLRAHWRWTGRPCSNNAYFLSIATVVGNLVHPVSKGLTSVSRERAGQDSPTLSSPVQMTRSKRWGTISPQKWLSHHVRRIRTVVYHWSTVGKWHVKNSIAGRSTPFR